MNNPECLSNLLQACVRKAEDFVQNLESKHLVWLREIEEEARRMFSSDFTAEPELMPKTPSQKRRRKKRTSIVPEENGDPSGRRISRRRSSASWSSSVRRQSKQLTKPLNESIQEESSHPKRLTRARAQASTICMPVSEKPLEELSLNMAADCILQVRISPEERLSAEQHLPEKLALNSSEHTDPDVYVTEATTLKTNTEPPVPITPEKNSRAIMKLNIAANSTPKTAVDEVEDMICDSPKDASHAAREQALELSRHSLTPTGPKSDRRSVRRSIVGRKSIRRQSLANQYSLAKMRESMTRKSIRRSVSKKKAMESSCLSYKSYQSSVEIVDEEISFKIRPEAAEPAIEAPADSPRRSMPTRNCKKIQISHLPDADQPPQMATRQSLTANGSGEETDQNIRRKSYKRAVDELSDDENPDEVNSPPRKKTSSPTCPPSKVVKPPPHLKTFLHTVQKNQLLMMTPGSISKTQMVKSFIKRNTPLKADPKEKERQRLEVLRKKEEAELQRKQKIEEGKKRKQEELKLKREERLRKVLQARERVEQLEEEKKKKMEQKFAQIDEKSEKVREDRMAEEKAKKKITAKKQEEVESRRRQEEDARKLKAKQLEEEERRQQEILQRKREEEEQERQRRLAEAKKMAEQERERQRALQLAAEREQERLRAERERMEKEKALQLQRELERAAQEKERREAEERRRKEQQEKMAQERLREEQQRLAQEQQMATNSPVLNVTVDLQNSPCESYEMTPKGYKPHPPKFNPEDYGMDLNSDDSTDDESKPRKPIPAWASGSQLTQAVHQQYHRPMNVNKIFGKIDSPNLELLFSKSKPRYYKRTSSAVWHSPPLGSNRQHLAVGYGLKKY
ncbi:inner centromere protein [Gastrophryne carolinensis]